MDENELFEQLVKNDSSLVIVFWAPWCETYISIAPVLKRLSLQYAGRVDVWQVDCAKNPELRVKFNITGLPTLVVMRGGQEITRCTGAASQTILSWLFDAAISGTAPAYPAYVLRECLVQALMDLSKTISRFEKGLGNSFIITSPTEPAHVGPD